MRSEELVEHGWQASRPPSGESGQTSNSVGTLLVSPPSGMTLRTTGQGETQYTVALRPTGPQPGALTAVASGGAGATPGGDLLPPSVQSWLTDIEMGQLRAASTGLILTAKPELSEANRATLMARLTSLSDLLAPASNRGTELEQEVTKLLPPPAIKRRFGLRCSWGARSWRASRFTLSEMPTGGPSAVATDFRHLPRLSLT